MELYLAVIFPSALAFEGEVAFRTETMPSSNVVVFKDIQALTEFAAIATFANDQSPNRPRIIPQERLLSRFYEPLVLLYTLGRTRGDHVRAATPSQKDIAHLPLLDIRRMFLNDLAYMCDYDKGGETVTAIGLQSTPQKHIFWVASNTGSKAKTIEFVRSILAQIIHISAASKASQPATELASQCIAFSTLRIKKYRNLLKPLLRKCTLYLAKIGQEVEPGLLEWLQSWEYPSSLLDLCCSAHASRKSNFMRALARLSAEPTYGSNRDAIHVAFGMIRHYIGRLGYHFRAADTLVACAPRLFYLLHDFEVCSVPIPVKSAIPPPDEMTTLDKILVRMLPANSPELHLYQEALAYMDDRYQLFSRYMDNYVRPNQGSCVHAEIQVLEHFYIHGMHFACDDPFIACSKPACFCCLLYFRHYPGHVVEPVSHNKIYLNWRPPDFNATAGIISPNHQRDILNAMNQEIRKEALHQLREKTAPRTWHPDSLTNITWSAPSEQSEQVVRGIDDAPGLAADRTVSYPKCFIEINYKIPAFM
ncbi:hypothetical protein COCSADRAFT_169339 [Bipolaris sorokiniana ND90Pr]|uniref:Uncharacterized protein n=1 Tax=Cochliobolus sativus (strain ND90Pr / ATCC 201652) TaxID=665912 RepID=M2SGN7_COCSN|nr:uncharacterized protein COCSADRAFT_169339 [Bipolaris sorokiniana ND90Pr]EMD66388.1 hypothetical protein COCSADRAFT_169339 [Bipolaris sorokiniana ND90Pr]